MSACFRSDFIVSTPEGSRRSIQAQRLLAMGYQVQGWSQTRKQIEGVQSFCGADDLPAFLQRSQVLICLLPDTEATRGMLNKTIAHDLGCKESTVKVHRSRAMRKAEEPELV